MQKLVKEDFTEILGQANVKDQIRSALIANRHVVIFGAPGIGKTTLARNISKLLPTLTLNSCDFNCMPTNPVCPGCRAKKPKTVQSKGSERFIRVQGSPDLSAEDLLGDIDPIKAIKFGATSIQAFTPGKIFKANNGILFFDELNRCPEKLQNTLLQVLEERTATIGSYDVDIDANFIFIATMNPHDTNTEKLSDVLLDRFDVIYMDYPETADIEIEIIKLKGKKILDTPLEMLKLMTHFVRHLREDEKLDKVPSVRASIGLYERAQGFAYLADRKSVIFEDIKKAVKSVLAHRIRLKPSLKYVQEPVEYLENIFEKFCENADTGGDG